MSYLHILDIQIQRLWNRWTKSAGVKKEQIEIKLKICLKEKIKQLEIEASYCMPQEQTAWYETRAHLELLTL